MLVSLLRSSFKHKYNILFFIISTILIDLSTIFIKQHVILDVLSGIFIAISVNTTVDYYMHKIIKKHQTPTIPQKQAS